MRMKCPVCRIDHPIGEPCDLTRRVFCFIGSSAIGAAIMAPTAFWEPYHSECWACGVDVTTYDRELHELYEQYVPGMNRFGYSEFFDRIKFQGYKVSEMQHILGWA